MLLLFECTEEGRTRISIVLSIFVHYFRLELGFTFAVVLVLLLLLLLNLCRQRDGVSGDCGAVRMRNPEFM